MPQTEVMIFADKDGLAPRFRQTHLQRMTMPRMKNVTNDAVEVLHKRYIQGDAKRGNSIEVERLSLEIARMIYDLRKEAGLSQKDLAKLIGTTQSVISRLEDSDYGGHSLSVLERIAKALDRRVTVSMVTEPRMVREDTVHYAFRRFVQNARRKSGLTLIQASQKLRIDPLELERIETDITYHASQPALRKLSRFYGVNEERLTALAGTSKNVSSQIKNHASKFAEESDCSSELAPAEKKALKEFMRFLRDE